MKIDDFNKLMEKAEKDLCIPDKVTTQVLFDMTISVTAKYQYWLGIYSATLQEYETSCLELEKLQGEEFKELKFGKKSQYAWQNKGDIESQYWQNPVLYDKKAECNMLKVQMTHLEKTLDNMKSLSWTLKNLIDIKKIQTGGF